MKKNIDLARAWRDQDYYLSLTDEERTSLKSHPGGPLADETLSTITGGCGVPTGYTACGGSASCTPCPPYWCN